MAGSSILRIEFVAVGTPGTMAGQVSGTCISSYNCFSSARKIVKLHLHLKIRSISTVVPVRGSARSNQPPRGDDDDDEGEKQLPRLESEILAKPILKFASDNFLPLALVTGGALGIANPTLGCLADKYYLSKLSTFGIFIL